ncbi:MAG: hypothetical protein M1133_12065 [Armatimonadetes bacterium]|nr:hypothetical protein [Armatimonadota bacterium]
MRLIRFAVGFILTLILPWGTMAIGADMPPAPEKVMITTTVDPNELREYSVNVTITGDMPNPDAGQPMKLDSTLCLRMVHKYGRREGDGLLPMEITLIDGSVLMGGQKLSIAPSIYPKLTVLLDSKFNIRDIYGISPTSYSASLPGINYGNMIILFYLPDGGTPHATGEKWDSKVTLPSLGEIYDFSNTLKSTGKTEGIDTATVQQEIVRVPKGGNSEPALKATGESTFSVATGKLMKSRVDCVVAFDSRRIASADGKTRDSKQEQTGLAANIKMDIALVK